MGADLRAGNPNIAELSDPYRPTKVAEAFKELYDNEWTDAFEELHKCKAMTEQDMIQCLMDVLQVCIIRIYHECEGRIDNSIPRINVWHHEACRVMTNCDHEGWIFISHPHKNNGFLLLLTIKYRILSLIKAHRSS